MKRLLNEIKACSICQEHIPGGPRPVISVSSKSRILIIGQAPGLKVHNTGIPWNDASGDELRRWLGVSKDRFYDAAIFGLMPMGFCYPGKGISGDLPPRPECAPAWHNKLLKYMIEVKLIILIGHYAQRHYLTDGMPTLTENVRNYKSFLPMYLPLVHPSPRNKIWMKKNPWFETDVLPPLRTIVRDIIQ